MVHRLICIALVLIFGAAVPTTAIATPSIRLKLQGWMTSLDGRIRLSPLNDDDVLYTQCGPVPEPHARVQIHENISFQPITGFGAALTESSALLMAKMEPELRKQFVTETFGKEGLGRMNLLRIPIGATDFSTHNYTCADASPLETHPNLAHNFNFNRCMKNILPMLEQIKWAQPKLKIIAAPWSPPAWMKSSQTLVGGKLLPQFYSEYAEYLFLFAKNMAVLGYPIEYLSVLNEPLFQQPYFANYPWAHMEAEEQAVFVGKFLIPTLQKNHLTAKIKILGYDHNWDQWHYPESILTHPDSAAHVTGTAFHCYNGHYWNAKKIKDLAPNKEIHLTECTSGNWSPYFDKSFYWGLSNLLLGHFSVGAQSLVYWNLLLDAHGGPTNGGCQDCRGVFNLTSDGSNYIKSPEYYILAQASTVITPGALLIESVSSTLHHQIAFKNGDNSLAWIGVNPSYHDTWVELQDSKTCITARLPALTALSLRWF